MELNQTTSNSNTIEININPYLIHSLIKNINKNNENKRNKTQDIDYIAAMCLSLNNPITKKLKNIEQEKKPKKTLENQTSTPSINLSNSSIQFTYYENPKLNGMINEKQITLNSNNENSNKNNENNNNNNSSNNNNNSSNNNNNNFNQNSFPNPIFYGKMTAFQNHYQNQSKPFQTQQKYSNLEQTIQNQNPSLLDLKYQGLEPILGRTYYSPKRF